MNASFADPLHRAADAVARQLPEPFAAVGELVVRAAQRRSSRERCVGRLFFDRPEFWQPAEPPDDGRRLGRVRLHVRFEGTASPWQPGALFLRLAFDNPQVRTVDAQAAVPGSAAAAPVLVSGLGSAAVGWYVEGSSDDVTSGEMTIGVHVEIPDGVDELVGTIMAEMPLVRAGLLRGRRAHARMAKLEEFTVRVPEQVLARRNVRADSVSGGPQGSAADRGASVRLCIAVDIERYRRFRTPEAVRAQARLLETLERMCQLAGIRSDRAETQASGDGQFVVFEPGLDESAVIPALVHGLELALTEVNDDLNEHARLRLRVALHRGHLTRGPNGWAGVASIAVHRILDSPPARRTLGEHPDADFALIVPDSLYGDVIAHGYGLLRPGSFSPVDVDMPAKGFSERAWVYVPSGA